MQGGTNEVTDSMNLKRAKLNEHDAKQDTVDAHLFDQSYSSIGPESTFAS